MTFAFGLGYVVPFVFPFLESALHIGILAIHSYSTAALAAPSAISPVAVARVLKGYGEPVKAKTHWLKGLGPLWKFSALNGIIGLGAGFYAVSITGFCTAFRKVKPKA